MYDDTVPILLYDYNFVPQGASRWEMFTHDVDNRDFRVAHKPDGTCIHIIVEDDDP